MRIATLADYIFIVALIGVVFEIIFSGVIPFLSDSNYFVIIGFPLMICSYFLVEEEEIEETEETDQPV